MCSVMVNNMVEMCIPNVAPILPGGIAPCNVMVYNMLDCRYVILILHYYSIF